MLGVLSAQAQPVPDNLTLGAPPQGIVMVQQDTRLSIRYHAADGALTRLENVAADLIVLNFWATWCPPCVEELPSLGQLRAAVRDDRIEVLALSVDRGGVPQTERFFRRIERPDLLYGFDPRARSMAGLEVPALPATAIILPDGQVLAIAYGALDWAEPEVVEWLRMMAAR